MFHNVCFITFSWLPNISPIPIKKTFFSLRPWILFSSFSHLLYGKCLVKTTQNEYDDWWNNWSYHNFNGNSNFTNTYRFSLINFVSKFSINTAGYNTGKPLMTYFSLTGQFFKLKVECQHKLLKWLSFTFMVESFLVLTKIWNRPRFRSVQRLPYNSRYSSALFKVGVSYLETLIIWRASAAAFSQ